MPPGEITPVKLFISYAHRDEALRRELTKHLATLKRQGIISEWHGREIAPGAEWDREIKEQLNEAQIVLLLVSPDFIASDYCYDIELARALERNERGETVVIPVVLRPTDWADTPLKRLQALPTGARPVTTWPNTDEAFFNVAQGIRLVAERLAGGGATRPEPPAESRREERAESTRRGETAPSPSSKETAPRTPRAAGRGAAKGGAPVKDGPKLPADDGPFPLRLLREAIRAVPAVKYALGVTGIAAAVSIVAGFRINLAVAVLGVVVMFVLMTLLVIFSSFARSSARSLRPLANTLAWAFVVLTIVTGFFIFTGFFFAWPRPLDQTAARLTGEQPPTPTHTPTPAATPETRNLSYSLLVCKHRTDPQCQRPFTLAREILFEEGYKIRLNVSSPQPGYLYVINEGPATSGGLPEYVFLFPTRRVNGGSAKLDPNQTMTFPGDKWLRFDAEEGKEKLWLVWSASADGDLEGVARNVFLRPEDQGEIKTPGDIVVVQRSLAEHSAAPPAVRKIEDLGRTDIEGRGATFAYALVLEHH
jgi:hypothetical protein